MKKKRVNKFNVKLLHEIIDQMYTDPKFNVSRMAKEMNMAVSYLSERIYFTFRVSPKILIENARLRKAVLLMRAKTDMRLVFSKAGYSNNGTFRKAFKRRLNMTPPQCSEWLAQQDNPESLNHLLDQLSGKSSYKVLFEFNHFLPDLRYN